MVGIAGCLPGLQFLMKMACARIPPDSIAPAAPGFSLLRFSQESPVDYRWSLLFG
jgi:hypothetical protein